MNLSDSVRYAKGVGPKKLALLAKLGIETIEDLVYYKPRDWNFVPDVTAIGDTKPDDKTLYLVRGMPMYHDTSSGGERITCKLKGEDTTYMNITLFNQRWFRFPRGVVYAYGKVTEYKGHKQMANPQIYAVGDDLSDVAGSVYPATAALPSHTIKRFIKAALEQVSILDVLPHGTTDLCEETALRMLHFPKDRDELTRALIHFKTKELLLMQLAIAQRRHTRKTGGGAKRCYTSNLDRVRFQQEFGFDLTESQRKAMAAIAADMEHTVPMNRLITGDVGSGKTAVAFYAMRLAAESGGQSVMMLPTEVLAQQHYADLIKLVPTDQVCLVTSSMSAGASDVTGLFVKKGISRYIVGTTAIQHRNFDYHDLRLVVFDEQHRFGVQQRAIQGQTPHTLTMTATPIPRTLMVAALSDMDHSHLEPWVEPDRVTDYTDDLNHLIQELDGCLGEGQQAFLVCSNIEDVGKWAYWLHAKGYNVRFAHGQMQKEHFEDNLYEFTSGAVPILVCTTVIEVGVHVPNAALMIITDPDRFGLAQLHQLRGRIGRSGRSGVCLLYTSPEDISEEAMKRVEFFCSTDSGEEVAYYDMKMRGPGAIFGTEQHGLPDLKYADILSDFKLLVHCNAIATSIITVDPELSDTANMMLGLLLRQKISDTDNFFST